MEIRQTVSGVFGRPLVDAISHRCDLMGIRQTVSGESRDPVPHRGIVANRPKHRSSSRRCRRRSASQDRTTASVADLRRETHAHTLPSSLSDSRSTSGFAVYCPGFAPLLVLDNAGDRPPSTWRSECCRRLCDDRRRAARIRSPIPSDQPAVIGVGDGHRGLGSLTLAPRSAPDLDVPLTRQFGRRRCRPGCRPLPRPDSFRGRPRSTSRLPGGRGSGRRRAEWNTRLAEVIRIRSEIMRIRQTLSAESRNCCSDRRISARRVDPAVLPTEGLQAESPLMLDPRSNPGCGLPIVGRPPCNVRESGHSEQQPLWRVHPAPRRGDRAYHDSRERLIITLLGMDLFADLPPIPLRGNSWPMSSQTSTSCQAFSARNARPPR